MLHARDFGRYPVADGPSGRVRVLLGRFGALHRLRFIRTRLDSIFNTRAAALATQLMDEVHYNYTEEAFFGRRLQTHNAVRFGFVHSFRFRFGGAGPETFWAGRCRL